MKKLISILFTLTLFTGPASAFYEKCSPTYYTAAGTYNCLRVHAPVLPSYRMSVYASTLTTGADIGHCEKPTWGIGSVFGAQPPVPYRTDYFCELWTTTPVNLFYYMNLDGVNTDDTPMIEFVPGGYFGAPSGTPCTSNAICKSLNCVKKKSLGKRCA